MPASMFIKSYMDLSFLRNLGIFQNINGVVQEIQQNDLKNLAVPDLKQLAGLKCERLIERSNDGLLLTVVPHRSLIPVANCAP